MPELPLVRALAETGITDFMAEIIGAVGTLPPGVTWATRAPGGFADADAALLRALGPHLVPLFGVGAERRKLDAVLRTYLGTAPGREVLGGHIQRGDVRRLDAIVLLTDLRGFTAMTASASEAELLATLDGYFEVVADAVQSHGGEVLKFIGDGVLSVFPVEAGRLAERARGAVAAARAAQAAGGAPFTAVLSSGPVAYGNIGARERLDFTVIGAAVNLASRIEAVAKRLGEPLVATAESPRRPARRAQPRPARAAWGGGSGRVGRPLGRTRGRRPSTATPAARRQSPVGGRVAWRARRQPEQIDADGRSTRSAGVEMAMAIPAALAPTLADQGVLISTAHSPPSERCSPAFGELSSSGRSPRRSSADHAVRASAHPSRLDGVGRARVGPHLSKISRGLRTSSSATVGHAACRVPRSAPPSMSPTTVLLPMCPLRSSHLALDF